MKPKIIIINSSSFGRIFTEHLRELESFADVSRIDVKKDISQEEFLPLLQGYHGIIASVTPHYPNEMISELTDLCAITRHGIGYNNIGVDGATKAGVVVTKVDGPVERNAVAEHAVALIMSACRHISPAANAVQNKLWKNRAQYIGTEISDKTIGIVGLGNIGSRTAEILARGFNAQVLVNDPNYSTEELSKLGYQKASLEEVFKKSTIVSLHCALTPSNHHMINSKILSYAKKGMILVNTARGELVEAQAIMDALNKDILTTYATDVIENEPIDDDHPFLDHDKILIVPHLGGYSYESLEGMGKTMVEDMKSVFCNSAVPEGSINKEVTQVKRVANSN